MTFELPTWFKGRQGKAEELSKAVFRLTGPNLPEGIVSAEITDNLTWRGSLKMKPDGPVVASSAANFDNPRDAMAAAFELYRTNCILG